MKYPSKVYYDCVGKSVGGRISETNKKWIDEYSRCFNKLKDVEFELSIVKEENMKLKYENEFMLNMINNHMIGIPDK